MGTMEKAMSGMPLTTNIFGTISAVMEDCGFVAKDSTNPTQKYKYRGIDAVMNALNPAMRKHHLFVVPEVLEQTREERQTTKGGLLIYTILKVKYTFYAQDGSCVSAVVMGEAMDSGDKSMNKAMSAAFKYALFQVFCIPTEEMRDTEADEDPQPIYEKISKKDIDILKKTISEENLPAWLKHFGKEKVEDLTKLELGQIYKYVQDKKEAQAKAEKLKEKVDGNQSQNQ